MKTPTPFLLKILLRAPLVLVMILRGAFAQGQTLDELREGYQVMPIDSLLALERTTPDIRLHTVLTDLIAQHHLYAGEVQEAMTTALRAMELAERSKNDSLITKAHISVGGAFSMVNDVNSALHQFNLALDLARRSGIRSMEGFAAKEIGILYRNGGDHRTALRFYHQALAMDLPDLLRSRTNSATGFSYLALGVLDSALHYAKEADVVRVPAEDPYGYIGSQYRLADVHTALKDYELAELYYKRALAADTFAMPEPLSNAAAGYARMLVRTGRPQEALVMARKAHALVASSRDPSEILPAAQVLAETFEANHAPDSALAWMKVERALRDSVQGSETRDRLQGQLFQMQLMEREDAKRKEEEADMRSHNIQFGIIALIVITLGIFLLIFSRTSVVGAKAIKNLSLVALLLFFEFINLLVHPVLGELTHHSPLLMLLCMAAIAALLIPLHHRMEKLITNMLVSRNNRVRLEAARRTIEELEAPAQKGPAHG